MKKKTIKRVPKVIFNTEQEYWDSYAKRSLSYKTIDLHNWTQQFQEVLKRNPEDKMAQNMLKRCAEEEKILNLLKEEQNKKSDELLLVKDQSVSRRPKK